MARDNSFLRLTKNNFAAAKNGDNPNIVTLPYNGFIQIFPNETCMQISNATEDIVFVGGITVDLIDCSEKVVDDITANFYYTSFTDSRGIKQIAFEFGNFNKDYSTTILYLRITDNTNGNKWYSNSFIITYYNFKQTTRFDYWADGLFNGIAYDIAPFKQSIRLSNCYYHTPVNEVNLQQYTKYSGKQANTRSITTYLKKYLIDNVDFFVNDRLNAMFESPFVYIDTERVMISNYNVGERLGSTNWFTGEFIANPQDEEYVYQYQIYKPFDDVATFVAQNSFYTLANFNTALTSGLYIQFNKAPLVVPTFEYKLWENGSLVLTGNDTTIVGDKIYLDDLQAYTFANGEYAITVASDLAYSGIEYWSGFNATDWNFEILSGEYDNTEYTTTEYLTN